MFWLGLVIGIVTTLVALSIYALRKSASDADNEIEQKEWDGQEWD